MKDECLICGAPLEYLEKEREMECVYCHKKEYSNTSCENGHYVCNTCHTSGLEDIISFCLKESSKNPVYILRKMMALPFCHMHGPEHHTLVGAALLTAFKNSGGEIDLGESIKELSSRAKKVPGGACGFWGACGAGVSSGMFISVVTGSTPLKNEEWAMSNAMTSKALSNIAALGGPRCCKRNSYTAILSAVDFVKTQLNIMMELEDFKCIHYNNNNQCIKERCPFYPL